MHLNVVVVVEILYHTKERKLHCHKIFLAGKAFLCSVHIVLVARLEDLRVLKSSKLEDFRALQSSKLGDFRALKPYDQIGVF